MERFNVGDKVVMVRPSCYSFDKVGNTGTVTSVEPGLVLVVVDDYRMPRGGGGWAYFESAENWELIKEESKVAKFKVGDRVKMVRLRNDGLSYSFDKIGNEGVVKDISSRLIQVDVHCKDNTWEGNGWNYSLECNCWEVIEEESKNESN